MKGSEIAEQESKIIQLERKVKELEQSNLKLQEYFSKISGRFSPNERSSPFAGNPVFSCTSKFTIDLELKKMVWFDSENDLLKCEENKLFLADTTALTSKLIAKQDRKRFKDILNTYFDDLEIPTQTILRIQLTDKKIEWVLACFEKVWYYNQPESYLQIQFILLDDCKELHSLMNEFIKKSENSDQYHKIELLTSRQREILQLLGKGFTSKEIAENLKISFHTVEAHRKTIAKKTKTKKRAELISLAAEIGILK